MKRSGRERFARFDAAFCDREPFASMSEQALGCYLRITLACAARLSDGRLPARAVRTVGRGVSELIRAGVVLMEADGTLVVHGFEAHYPSRADAEEASRAAAAAAGARWGRSDEPAMPTSRSPSYPGGGTVVPPTVPPASHADEHDHGNAPASIPHVSPRGTDAGRIAEPMPTYEVGSRKQEVGGKRARGAPKRPVPEPFPDGEALAYAATAGMPEQVARAELAKLVDWAKANGERKVDWNATARNWLRRVAEQRGFRPPADRTAVEKHQQRLASLLGGPGTGPGRPRDVGALTRGLFDGGDP